MPKYNAYITYKETRMLEVEADDEEAAKELAYDNMDSAEPFGDDDYEIEIEEAE